MASVLNFSANAMNPTDYVKNEEMSGELVQPGQSSVMRMVIYSVTCVILMAMTMRVV